MTSQITYLGDIRTEALHVQSGTIIETDGPTDNHGKGERFSPTDLLATALGSCMLSIMGIVAIKHQLEITQTKVDVEKIMIADPLRRIGEIRINFHFPPGVICNEAERAILEKAALTCPVYLSLHANVIKTVNFNWG